MRVDHARWWRAREPRTLVARTSADHCTGMDDSTCARVLVCLANGHHPSRVIDEAAYVRATLAHHRVELAAQREMWYILSDVIINGHGEYPHTRLADANVRRKRAHASVKDAYARGFYESQVRGAVMTQPRW